MALLLPRQPEFDGLGWWARAALLLILLVKTREIIYLLFKQRWAPSLPILQSLHGRKMP